jgi:uncharacterized protein (UPF0333 family)
MRKGKKAQATVELIVILAISLLVLSIIIFAGTEHMRTLRLQANLAKAQQAANTIAQTAELVYAHAPGSAQTIVADFPENTAPERVFLQGRFVNIGVYTGNAITDINAKTSMPLKGSLPKTGGVHRIKVESREGYVLITEVEK